MTDFIKNLPKAELHIHIEGSLEPEQVLRFAQRNNIELPYKNLESIRASYQFKDLSSFIDLYQLYSQALVTEQDFCELMYAYLKKANQQGVRHAEVFFEVQSYAQRGIQFKTIINGLHKGITEAQKKYAISCYLILTFIRDFDESSALTTLQESLDYQDKIIGIGLASREIGNPPEKFRRVYAKAKQYGYHTTIHAGEEAGPEYMWQALNELTVERIDHGVQCMQDIELVHYLIKNKIPLTLCPLSNICLQVYDSLKQHPIKKMLDLGLIVSVSSDDPAYFGGYIADNYQAVADTFNLSAYELATIARNSFASSFLNKEMKAIFIAEVDAYVENFLQKK